MSTTMTVSVHGMTCRHFVNAVESELAKIAGVTGVRAELETGVADITSDAGVERAAVAAAVNEAEYELAP